MALNLKYERNVRLPVSPGTADSWLLPVQLLPPFDADLEKCQYLVEQNSFVSGRYASVGLRSYTSFLSLNTLGLIGTSRVKIYLRFYSSGALLEEREMKRLRSIEVEFTFYDVLGTAAEGSDTSGEVPVEVQQDQPQGQAAEPAAQAPRLGISGSEALLVLAHRGAK